MKNIIVFIVSFILCWMFWSVAFAEQTSIQIEESDDVYIILNGDNQTRIDCVPDENTTQDVEGFCNVMQSTYYYCDSECMTDEAMQSNVL